MPSKIDLHANYFRQGDFWTIDALEQVNENDSEPFGDSQEASDEESAIQEATAWAELLVSQGREVTVFVNGNEHRHYQQETQA